MIKKLLDIEDAEKLSIEETVELSELYINQNQSNIFSKLPWGKELFGYAEGMYMHTKSNKKILDFTGGIGVLGLGHNHPEILKARIDFQKNKRMEVHKLVFSPYMAAISKNLAQIMPGDLNKVFVCNSGAESVEGSLKLAYKSYNGSRKYVLHSDISYHGRLIASGSISGQEDYDKNFQKIPNTISFKFNDIESVKEIINKYRDSDGKSLIYCIAIETFSASNIQSCSDEFIKGLDEICKKEDINILVDEVYVGWGKTGYLFSFLKFKNFIPDIVTTSKTFGGGKSSISAYIASDKIYKKAYGTLNDAFLHTSTYNGFGEECATALKAMNIIIRENYVERSKEINKIIIKKMLELQKAYPKIIKEIRGSGCLNGIEIFSPYDSIEKLILKLPINFIQEKKQLFNKITSIAISYEMYQNYNILIFVKETRNKIYLSLSPSMIVNDEEIGYVINSLEKVFKKGIYSVVNNFYKNILKEYLFNFYKKKQ